MSRNRYPCPGLPLYLHAAPPFSSILIFVPTSGEAKRVLDRLKAQYDSRYEPNGDELHLENMRNTRVIALEELPTNEVLRIESIPSRHLSVMRMPEPSKELVTKVQEALRAVNAAAQAGADAAYAAARKDKEGHVLEPCGFASLMISAPQSELTAPLLKLGAIEPLGHLGYMFTSIVSFRQACADPGRSGQRDRSGSAL